MRRKKKNTSHWIKINEEFQIKLMVNNNDDVVYLRGLEINLSSWSIDLLGKITPTICWYSMYYRRVIWSIKVQRAVLK